MVIVVVRSKKLLGSTKFYVDEGVCSSTFAAMLHETSDADDDDDDDDDGVSVAPAA